MLSVTDATACSRPDQFFQHLASLGSIAGPTKTRYLKSEDVTRELLEREQRESVRVQGRVAVLNAWSAAPVEELVEILERGEYRPPMQLDFDSRVIVDHLWEGHRDELEDPLRQRLRALVGTDVLCEAASRNLNAMLCALDGDGESLRAIWRRDRPGRVCFADDFLLMDCFAHVRIEDRDILDDIIAIVESPWPFGARREAMLALGKLGCVAGNRAAEVIRKCIYDSSPEVAAERDRVLERIETPTAGWEPCGACCYGRVHSVGSHGMEACPECLGLGCVKREEPATGAVSE